MTNQQTEQAPLAADTAVKDLCAWATNAPQHVCSDSKPTQSNQYPGMLLVMLIMTSISARRIWVLMEPGCSDFWKHAEAGEQFCVLYSRLTVCAAAMAMGSGATDTQPEWQCWHAMCVKQRAGSRPPKHIDRGLAASSHLKHGTCLLCLDSIKMTHKSYEEAFSMSLCCHIFLTVLGFKCTIRLLVSLNSAH